MKADPATTSMVRHIKEQNELVARSPLLARTMDRRGFSVGGRASVTSRHARLSIATIKYCVLDLGSCQPRDPEGWILCRTTNRELRTEKSKEKGLVTSFGVKFAGLAC